MWGTIVNVAKGDIIHMLVFAAIKASEEKLLCDNAENSRLYHSIASQHLDWEIYIELILTLVDKRLKQWSLSSDIPYSTK